MFSGQLFSRLDKRPDQSVDVERADDSRSDRSLQSLQEILHKSGDHFNLTNCDEI